MIFSIYTKATNPKSKVWTASDQNRVSDGSTSKPLDRREPVQEDTSNWAASEKKTIIPVVNQRQEYLCRLPILGTWERTCTTWLPWQTRWRSSTSRYSGASQPHKFGVWQVLYNSLMLEITLCKKSFPKSFPIKTVCILCFSFQQWLHTSQSWWRPSDIVSHSQVLFSSTQSSPSHITIFPHHNHTHPQSPNIFFRAAAARHGPLGLIHVDAHSDTAESVSSSSLSSSSSSLPPSFESKSWSRWWARGLPTGPHSDAPGKTDYLTTQGLFRLITTTVVFQTNNSLSFRIEQKNKIICKRLAFEALAGLTVTWAGEGSRSDKPNIGKYLNFSGLEGCPGGRVLAQVGRPADGRNPESDGRGELAEQPEHIFSRAQSIWVLTLMQLTRASVQVILSFKGNLINQPKISTQVQERPRLGGSHPSRFLTLKLSYFVTQNIGWLRIQFMQISKFNSTVSSVENWNTRSSKWKVWGRVTGAFMLAADCINWQFILYRPIQADGDLALATYSFNWLTK